MPEALDTLVICCGAIAKEIIAISRQNGWENLRVECLPASLHNDPDQLPERVRGKIVISGPVTFACARSRSRLCHAAQRLHSHQSGPSIDDRQ